MCVCLPWTLTSLCDLLRLALPPGIVQACGLSGPSHWIPASSPMLSLDRSPRSACLTDQGVTLTSEPPMATPVIVTSGPFPTLCSCAVPEDGTKCGRPILQRRESRGGPSPVPELPKIQTWAWHGFHIKLHKAGPSSATWASPENSQKHRPRPTVPGSPRELHLA